jgi:O-succinylbenzoate synthase
VVGLKISHFHVFQFTLPLSRPLTIGKDRLEERSGFIVELGSSRGDFAIGESSPLPGFSPESLEQAGRQLAGLGASILGREIPENLGALAGGFDDWLIGYKLAPSVRFGFETAVLGLVAAAKGVAPPELLSNEPSHIVPVNGLLSGARSAIMDRAEMLLASGYNAFKLKVGRLSLDDDLAVVRELKSLVGDDVVLRLDANRAWGVEDAIAFAHGLSDTAIDYIEEPVVSFDLLIQLAQEPRMCLPLAIDESLLEIEPEDLSGLPKMKAVVLKPTLLGFEKTMRFARTALEVGMTPVISSAFESGVGVTVLAQIASSLNLDHVPAGLDTLDWFGEDLLENAIRVENGKLAVSALPSAVEALKGHLLQVADDA